MSFDDLWHRHEFELTDTQATVGPGLEEGKRLLCGYAVKFSEWAEELCISAIERSSIVSINQAKVMLLDRYMEWRNFVPRRHRSLTSIGANSHTCIFHVFETAYDRLKVVELSLTPPMLFLPPPAPPPRAVTSPLQLAGVFIGEIEEE